MATPEQLLRKLDERYILGEIAEAQYQQMRSRLQAQLDETAVAGARLDEGAAPSGSLPGGAADAHAGGMDISDSVIKGNVTSGSASVGSINIQVGQGKAAGASAELEYEECVMLTLRSGGSLESIRRELDSRRLSIGLPIRLAREIEAACLESCGRRPIHGGAFSGPAGPAGPDPLTRFFKSASESIASMFATPRHSQPGPPPNRPTPVPPVYPSAPRPGGGPPPVPWMALTPATAAGLPPAVPTATDDAASVKEALKEELRAGLKADLAAVEKKDETAGEAGKPAHPVNVEEEAPAPRKPPPLPPMPPPLQWPMKGKPG